MTMMLSHVIYAVYVYYIYSHEYCFASFGSKSPQLVINYFKINTLRIGTHIPIKLDAVLHLPLCPSFHALTSNLYLVSGLRPDCLVRRTLVSGALTVIPLYFSKSLSHALKRTSYVVTSPAALALSGLSQFRVTDGWLVSKTDLKF